MLTLLSRSQKNSSILLMALISFSGLSSSGLYAQAPPSQPLFGKDGLFRGDVSDLPYGVNDAGAVLRMNADGARSIWTHASTDIRTLAQRIVDMESKIQEVEATLPTLRSQLQALKDNKDKEMDDFRHARWCSKCHRSATQILAETGESFEAHIAKVEGVIDTPTQADIDKREAELDAGIAAKQKELDDASSQVSDFTSQRLILSNRLINVYGGFWEDGIRQESTVRVQTWATELIDIRTKIRTLQSDLTAANAAYETAVKTGGSPSAQAGLAANREAIAEQIHTLQAQLLDDYRVRKSNMDSFMAAATADQADLHDAVAKISDRYILFGSAMASHLMIPIGGTLEDPDPGKRLQQAVNDLLEGGHTPSAPPPPSTDMPSSPSVGDLLESNRSH